ncbi:HAD family hydrolase [Sorangium sp. So ce1335]|uniref:HAD family hydrolase n=1 Tax=Sorangium sp. So ce1335 TaxID=3133335 RepID=UPI003F640C9E
MPHAVPPIHAVLFDFARTLFRLIDPVEMIRDIATEHGHPEIAADAEELARVLGDAHLHPEVVRLWELGDLSEAGHLAYRTGWIARVAKLGPILDPLAAAMANPARWPPYADTAEVLAGIAERGIPIAVVSNIGWDIRAAFARHGLDRHVDVWTLSYEVGAMKPSPAIFKHALRELGVAGRNALMVGDTPGADGGATAVGCRVLLLPGAEGVVSWLAPSEEVRGLGAVLHLLDAANRR